MEAGKFLALLGGILTLLGTYVFALYGSTGIVGSGIGYILNIGDLFGEADSLSTLIDTPIGLYYVIVVLLIVFLASGVLQMIGSQSRAVSFIFSLFPLGVGLMLVLLVYTDILGTTSGFFTITFMGEQYGDFFPILINLGDLGLGPYLLISGGVLGVISVFLTRED